MAVEFEPLVFEIKQGSNDAAKGVDELVQSLGKLKSVTGNLSVLTKTTSQLKKLNAELGKFQNVDKLAKLAGALASLSKISNIKVPTGFYKNLAGIAGATTILTEEGVSRFERLAAALKEVGRVGNIKIPNTNVPGAQNTAVLPRGVPKDSGIQHSSAMSEAQNRINAVRSFLAEIRSRLEEVRASTAAAVQQSEATSQALAGISKAASIAVAAINAIIKAVKWLIGVLKKLAAILKTVIIQIGKMAASIGRVLLRPFTNFGKQINKAVAGVKQFFSSISRIAMYRLIRTAIAFITQGIKTGIDNLYQWSKLLNGSFAKSMDKIATSALYVKNSLAAMVAPLINAVAPVIDMLGDKMVDLMNKINLALARLFGQSTYIVAKKISDEYGKIKSHLIGIDELNVIQEDNPPYNEMFEELPITGISDLIERLKEAFERGDWEGLGRLLGDKVNDAIDAIDWSGIGKKIGYWLDAAIKTAYFFLKEIDFQKAGASVADLINSLLEAVDWEYLGRLLVLKITSMWDFAIGFLKELDWGEVGHSLFTFIIGALDEFSEWLDEIDWVSLGETLLQKIKDFFEEFDWKEIIKTISTTLGKVVKSMKDLLTPLWNSFKEWWNEHIKGKDFLETIKNLGEYLVKFVDEYIVTPFFDALFGGSKGEGKFDPNQKLMDNMKKYMEGDTVQVGDMLKDVLTDTDLSLIDKFKAVGQLILYGVLYGIHMMIEDKWLLKFFVDPFLGIICKLFGIHSPAKEMEPIGNDIYLGVLEGMNPKTPEQLKVLEMVVIKFIEAIGKFIADNLALIKENGKKILNAIGDGITSNITAFLEIFTDLLKAVDNILNAGATLVVTVIDSATEVVESIAKAAKDILGAGATLVVTAINAASGVIEAIGQEVQGVVTAGASLVITAIDAASGVIKSIGQALEGIVSAGANLVITAIDAASGVIEAVGQAARNIVTAGANLIVTAIDAASGVIEAVGQAAQSIVRAGANLVVTAIDAASGVIEAVGQAAQRVVDAGANLIVTAMDAASVVIESVAQNVADLMSAHTNLVITATDAASSVISSIGSAVSGLIGAGANLIIAGIDNATSIVNAVGQNATQTIKGTESNVNLTATDNATPVINQVQSALDRLDKNITVTINIQVNGQIPSLHALGGVAHATGGIVPHATGSIIAKPTLTNYRGTTHLFGEAGREAILPLDSYTGWMDEVADRTRQALEDESGFEENSFGRALTAFYTNYLEPVMSRMDDNMQRQADKTDQPVVRISGRDVRNAYDTQRKSDGYSFTR